MSIGFLWRDAWCLALSFALAAISTGAGAVDLLTGSSASGRISHLDAETGALQGIFLPPCALGFTSSFGPRLGPDGRIYVGTAGGVYRIDASTGEFIDVFIAGLPGNVLGTVVAPDGTLWGTLGPGNALFHADVNGTLLGPLVSTPFPTGIAVGSDGNLYVGSSNTGAISRFDPTTGALIGTFGTAPGPISGLSFGPDGDIYVALWTLNDVGRFDGATGAYLGSFIPAGATHPSSPRGPSWGPDGHLYVSSNATGEVLRYDGATGAFLGVFASGLEAPGAPGFVSDMPSSFGQLPPVATPSGPVAGFLDCGVRKYQGIPYAEAPTNALRWRRPVRKAASPATILALAHGSACPQLNGSSAVGSEDCLKLSIWRPDSPPATPLPVLFYIHGGGLSGGSISWGGTDGSVLARDQNVIVVEPQYRLGALGFFGLPELAAEDANGSTGNYGLLDQIEALKWVRDNIAAFGGDPNQVTIWGESAGGTSVCALMASPLSDGLFRAGIVQSGSCTYSFPLTLPPGSPVAGDPLFGTIYARSQAVATSAGCAAGDLACLRALPASTLVQALGAQPRAIDGGPAANLAIDGYALSEQPVVMLRNGAADGRPLMIGSVANESTYFTQGLELSIPTPSDYESLLRATVGNTRASALLSLYPAASAPTPAEAFRRVIEDGGFVCPTLDSADAIVAGGSPAFAYHLTFVPTYSSPTQSPLRTFHGLDGYYVFGTLAQLGGDYGILVDGDDDALSDSMQNAWGSFVKTGVPVTVPAWPVYAPATPGDLASVSVLLFNSPNSTIPGNLFRSGRCAALWPVANLLDVDRDVITYDIDNCPTLANTAQTDAELDAVGNVCDNCMNVANARVASNFLAQNSWATLTGGQRDDDHDGYGNICDGDFGNNGSTNVADTAQYKASLGDPKASDVCGTAGNRPCAIFDINAANSTESSAGGISVADTARYKQLIGSPPGQRCAACPLPCSAGADGSCN